MRSIQLPLDDPDLTIEGDAWGVSCLLSVFGSVIVKFATDVAGNCEPPLWLKLKVFPSGKGGTIPYFVLIPSIPLSAISVRSNVSRIDCAQCGTNKFQDIMMVVSAENDWRLAICFSPKASDIKNYSEATLF